MKRAITYLLILFVGLGRGFTQTEVLAFEAFASLVKSNHPLTRIASIQAEIGQAELLKAFGGFDPKIEYNLSQKQFDDKLYYSIGDATIKIPTWFGIELSSGFNENDGSFLNNENVLPPNGLFHAGASIELGNGLLIDKRRAELRKAKQYLRMNEEQRNIILNTLYYEAFNAYWDWYYHYNTLLINQDAYKVANDRFSAVLNTALAGDRPMIDTLEAGIQVQNRLLNLQQSELDFTNAGQQLAIYMWDSIMQPISITEGQVPQSLNEDIESLNTDISLITIDSIIINHPEVRKLRSKINVLQVDERFAREQVKPVATLKYNALNQVVGNDVFNNYSIENYTWGINFSMPLLLRKERGDLKIAKLRVEESNNILENKFAILRAKAFQTSNAIRTTNEQISMYQKTVNDYEQLLEGERVKFNSGESSLFLVNSRELGYIQSQIKLNELACKSIKYKIELLHALGTLYNN